MTIKKANDNSKLLGPVIISITNMGAMSQPDVSLSHDVIHEEGWDSPNKPKPSQDLYLRISYALWIVISLDEFGESTSDFDSHANMYVFGKNCIMIMKTGKTVEFIAFIAEVGGLNKVLIVNVIVTYKCSSTRKLFFLSR